jgi:soluble lytic murein transglycosylase-like protein
MIACGGLEAILPAGLPLASNPPSPPVEKRPWDGAGPHPAAVRNVVLEAAREHRVDPAFVESVISAESEFQCDAVSPRGALGLMQVMPETAEELGYDARDWEQNIEAGTAYLGILLRKYSHYPNKVQMALAAYNAGPGTVERYRGIPPFRATRTYIHRVLSHYRLLKQSAEPAVSEPRP